MKAAILVGGLGTRLRSAVPELPKPLADINGQPFLYHLLSQLKKNNLRQVVLCVGYRWQEIQKVFGDGSALEMELTYSIEHSPLGTGGALKHAEHLLQSTFLAMNGDSFLDLDLEKLQDFHNQKKTVATLALPRVKNTGSYGTVTLDSGGRITAFREKQATPQSDGLINGGIYIMEPELLSLIPKGVKHSLEHEVFPALVKQRAIHGLGVKGYFIDIGTPENYFRFQEDMEENT